MCELRGIVETVQCRDVLQQRCEALCLCVAALKKLLLGGSIDIEDAEATYHQLFEVYKQYQEESEKKKAPTALPKINLSLPKLNMPSIKIQSPFVIGKKGTNSIAGELPENVETDTNKE